MDQQIRRIVCCRAKDCNNQSFKNPEVQYISFPNTREKFQLWAALCGRHDLMNVPEYTFQNYHLCSIHFEKDQYVSDQTISIDAVPTIFSSESDAFEDEDTASVVNEVPDFDPDQPSSSQFGPGQNKSTITQTIRVVPPNILRGVTNQPKKSMPVQQKTVSLPKPVVKRLQGTKAYLSTKPQTIRLNAAALQSAEAGDVIHKDGKKYIILRKKVKGQNLTNKNPQGVNVNSTSSNVSSKTTNNTNPSINTQTKAQSPLIPRIDTSAIDLPPALPSHVQHVINNPRSDKSQGTVISLPKRSLPGTPKPVQPLMNVAPSLPIPSKREKVVDDCYTCLRPKPWQDWPVSEGLFLSAAKQLLANYQKIFPRGERMDIETTLHLASHFNILDPLSKSHCRARVHHFLKILEIELAKTKKTAEREENSKKPTTKAKRKTAHTNILIDHSTLRDENEESSDKHKDSSKKVTEDSEELSFLSNEMEIAIEEVDNIVTTFLDEN